MTPQTLTAICIAVLLTTHFVADFIMQNDWMAHGKSKHMKPLLVHVVMYSVGLSVGIALIQMYIVPTVSSAVGVILVGLNFVAHFLVDFVTSRLNSWLIPKADGKPDVTRSWHWFFVGIGWDQLLHGLCLVATGWCLAR